MATDNLDTSALTELRSSEPQSLLDEIDSLRLQGISDFVFLPQIVVCGDQSSGKSSVLKAISGVPFPRNDTLCTRIATEVILRPAPTAGAVVSIAPSQDSSDAERLRLDTFKESLQGLDQSEKNFLSEGVWRELPRDMVGVEALRQHLSKILLNQIKRYLPNLMGDMQYSIEECEKKLLRLRDSHDTPEKQRQFLLRLSESFQTLCRAAVDANYDHGFFSTPLQTTKTQSNYELSCRI